MAAAGARRALRDVAVRRLAALAAQGPVSREQVALVAQGAGVSDRTVWRWLAQVEQSGASARAQFTLDAAVRERLVFWRGNVTAVAAATIPGSDAHRYGILHPRSSATGQLLEKLIEKPDDYTAPTAFINISRTLLPAEAMTYFQKLTPAANGEYQATDAVNAFARDYDTLIHPVTGQYHDCGNPAGLLAANNAAAALERS